MGKKRALGRGIEALIPVKKQDKAGSDEEGQLQNISVGDLVPNPYQPRKEFSPQELEELARSVREKGVLEPLRARQHQGEYQLIYGERRWRAARQAGLKSVPVIVCDVDDREMLEIAIIENVQRQDLSPLEEAAAYQVMLKRGMSQNEVAKRVGKDRASVANILRLLRLPKEVKRLLSEGSLQMGHARALLGLSRREDMVRLAKIAAESGLSVRQVENAVKTGEKGKKKKVSDEAPPEIERILERLRQRLGTKVSISYRRGRGKLVVSFFSDDDLERLVSLIDGR